MRFQLVTISKGTSDSKFRIGVIGNSANDTKLQTMAKFSIKTVAQGLPIWNFFADAIGFLEKKTVWRRTKKWKRCKRKANTNAKSFVYLLQWLESCKFVFFMCLRSTPCSFYRTHEVMMPFPWWTRICLPWWTRTFLFKGKKAISSGLIIMMSYMKTLRQNLNGRHIAWWNPIWRWFCLVEYKFDYYFLIKSILHKEGCNIHFLSKKGNQG